MSTIPELQYYIGGIAMPAVDSQVDLIITINSKLNWSQHIYLYESRKLTLSATSSKSLFSGLTESCFLWLPNLRKHILLLERVQRRFIKWIPSITNLCYDDRFTYLELTALNKRRSRGDLIQISRIL